MKIAVYAGSFDPITNGHIDVIERAGKVYDKVVVCIAINSKKKTLFSMEERLHITKSSLDHISNVEVETHSGLIVDFAMQKKAISLIRGLRSVTDFEYEMQIALMNRKMMPSLQTVFMMPHEKYTYLNSSIIRELARYQRNVSEFVPEVVEKALEKKFSSEVNP